MSSQDVNIWYIECGAHLGNGYFTRNHVTVLEKVNEFRFKHNNTGVYQTAYMYDSPVQKEANMIGDFYLDLDTDLHGDDPESAFNLIREDAISCISYLKFVFGIPQQFIHIYFSGNKGIHITVPYQVFNIQPNTKLNAVYRSIAEEINKASKHQTIDLKIYDNKRLFRMVNSKHNKSGLYKIPLSHTEIRQCKLEEIKRLAVLPRAIPKGPEPTMISQATGQYQVHTKKLDMQIAKRAAKRNEDLKPLDFTPPCIESLLENTVKEGQRNCSVAILASFFCQQGMSQDEAKERLDEWNNIQCSPPMNDNEIEITLNSVYNGGYSYGCSTARILSACEEDECPIGKRKKR